MSPTRDPRRFTSSESLSGLADVVVGFALDVAVRCRHEITPHFVDVGAGQWAGTVLVMNKDTWESLSEEQQRAIEAASRTSKNLGRPRSRPRTRRAANPRRRGYGVAPAGERH